MIFKIRIVGEPHVRMAVALLAPGAVPDVALGNLAANVPKGSGRLV